MKYWVLGLLFGMGQAFAAPLDPIELPESARTVGKGTTHLHPGLFQSSYGLSDTVDVRTRVTGLYFGFNAQVKMALMDDEDHALSVEPGVHSEWPWAPLGFPSYSVGATARYSKAVGEGQLNIGLGAYYDVLKVTFRLVQTGEFDASRGGFELVPEYSVSLFRSPMAFGHTATRTPDGWDFKGLRVPLTVGYVHRLSESSLANMVLRVHPLNLMNGGSWGMELNPSWNHAMNDRFRFALGLNLVYPGLPLPVADDALASEIDRAEDNKDFRFWMNVLPEMPVAPLPHVALWWVF